MPHVYNMQETTEFAPFSALSGRFCGLNKHDKPIAYIGSCMHARGWLVALEQDSKILRDIYR